jgi:hypothetical protein
MSLPALLGVAIADRRKHHRDEIDAGIVLDERID